MAPRCNCGAGTCACSVTPGVGISIKGNGSTGAPYEITNTQGSLGQQLIVSDTETVDLALSPSNPDNLTGAWVLTANAAMALTDLTDVGPDQVLVEGDVPVWRTDHWEFEAQTGGSGVPAGGTDGQVLTKQSATDGDVAWETPTGGGSAAMEPTYAASRQCTTALSIPSGGAATVIPFDTEVYNEGIPWEPASNLFRIPVDGYYQISAVITYAVNATGARAGYIVLNSAGVVQAYESPDTDRDASVVIAGTVKCKAGEYITIRTYQNSGAALALNAVPINNTVSIHKVPALSPGGGGVVVERPVAVSRRQVATVTVANTTAVTIPFDTEDYNESDIAFSGGVFTIGSAGYYQINAKMNMPVQTGVKQIALLKNGSSSDAGIVNTSAASNTSSGAQLSRTLKLVPGDTLQVQAWQNSGAVSSIAASSVAWTSIDITKLPAAYAGSAVSTYGERNYSTSRQQAAVISAVNNTNTPVPWDTEVYTDGITFAAGVFTVPVAGYYQVNAKVSFAVHATGVRQIRILQNGASANPGITQTGSNTTGSQTVGLSRTLKCAAGDTLQVQASQTSGAALDMCSAGIAYNNVDITKVPAPVVNGHAASGVWGVGALDAPLWATGTTDLMGREIYIDSNGQLRGKPDIIYLARPPTDLPPTYPSGSTVMGVGSSDAAAMGWPALTSCIVVTHKRSDTGTAAQWCYLNSGTVSKAWYRNGTTATWAPWVLMIDSANVAGYWTDCALEVRFCTDVSSVANTGQSITQARYSRVGKTVTFSGRGLIGTGAVANYALLLPPSAGVPSTGGVGGQAGAPQAIIGGGEAVLGGWLLLTQDRIVNRTGASTAYSDSVANQQYIWNFTYEVV